MCKEVSTLVFKLKYKCFLMPNGLPYIEYTYRGENSNHWEENKVVAIDHYAQKRWKEWYYLPVVSEHYRAVHFQELLKEKYDGDFEEYVKAMVEHEIMQLMISLDTTELHSAQEIYSAYLTDGWKACDITVEKEAW